MRWLIDEGLPKALVEWLAERGHDVLDVAASSLRGSTDNDLWCAAARQNRTVLTRDVGFVPPYVEPAPPGVVLVRAPDTWRADAILRLVQDGLARIGPEALAGSMTVIQPGRVRQRPLASVLKHRPASGPRPRPSDPPA